MTDASAKPLALQDLPELRRKTDLVSRFLREQVLKHLETLRPLLAPDRVFGRYAGGRSDATGAERALSDLQQAYKPFTSKPYDLPEAFDTSWLTLVGNTLDLHPWEYRIAPQGKPITLSSPVKWGLAYRSGFTLAEAADAVTGRAASRPELLRQFVVNALVLQVVLARYPGVVQLFHDLRFELSTETVAELGRLPVVSITSCLTSFRPPDDLVLAATAFSGVPAFVELIDLEAVRTPRDFLKERLEELLR